jgi:hypothetical protein
MEDLVIGLLALSVLLLYFTTFTLLKMRHIELHLEVEQE